VAAALQVKEGGDRSTTLQAGLWLLHCRKKKVETAPQLCRQDCGCCTAGKRRRWLSTGVLENSSVGFTRRGSVESHVLPRLVSYDRLRVLVIHEWVTTVEDQAIIHDSVKLRDVLSRSAKTGLTIKQAQLNTRIPPIQFGGFSVYLFRRFAPLQYTQSFPSFILCE
jgi:hypothetical protein